MVHVHSPGDGHQIDQQHYHMGSEQEKWQKKEGHQASIEENIQTPVRTWIGPRNGPKPCTVGILTGRKKTSFSHICILVIPYPIGKKMLQCRPSIRGVHISNLQEISLAISKIRKAKIRFFIFFFFFTLHHFAHFAKLLQNTKGLSNYFEI